MGILKVCDRYMMKLNMVGRGNGKSRYLISILDRYIATMEIVRSFK